MRIGCGVRGAGCGVRGAGCGVRGAGCGVRGAGCGVRGAGCGVRGAGLIIMLAPSLVTHEGKLSSEGFVFEHDFFFLGPGLGLKLHRGSFLLKLYEGVDLSNRCLDLRDYNRRRGGVMRGVFVPSGSFLFQLNAPAPTKCKLHPGRV